MKVTSESAIESLSRAMTQLGLVYDALKLNYALLNESAQLWKAAELKLASSIDEMSTVLGDIVFPNNKYSRRKADVRGSTLHLPGLIKAVITDWNYKKYLSSHTAGGKRQYNVTIALDTSLSMDGHLGQCAIEALVGLTSALSRVGIENFTILYFGERVQLIKTANQEWGPAAMAMILTQLKFEQYATRDSEVVEAALDLLQLSSVRGAKKVFVLTDGYGTSGLSLTQALKRADEEGVEVIGIGVGFDQFFVPHCYQRWITASLPTALSDAFRSLYESEADESSGSGGGANSNKTDHKTLGALQALLCTSVESLNEIKQTLNNKVFRDDLQKKLANNRQNQLKVLPGSMPGTVTIQICFCIDVTGSMAPYIRGVKASVQAIVKDLSGKVKERFRGLTFAFEFGLVAYRDFDTNINSITSSTPRASNIVVKRDFDSKDIKHQNLLSDIQRLDAAGGADIAEDVTGALYAATQLNWTAKARFLMLITDAPGHGTEFAGGSDDRLPNGDPSPMYQPKVVIDQIVNKRLQLMFCPVNRPATQVMERRIRSLYDFTPPVQKVQQLNKPPAPNAAAAATATASAALGLDSKDPSAAAGSGGATAGDAAPPPELPPHLEKRELLVRDMIEISDHKRANDIMANRFHIIFVLDESGSMAGDAWQSLVNAYNAFLSRRGADQGTQTLVSVIQFSDSARVIYSCLPMNAVGRSLPFKAGGTEFGPAFKCALTQIALKPDFTPLILFMSDGDDGKHGPCPEMAAIVQRYPKVQVHAIGFGNKVDTRRMTAIASQARGGTYKTALTAIDLSKAFVEVAQGCTAMEGLITSISDKITDLVAEKIITDYL